MSRQLIQVEKKNWTKADFQRLIENYKKRYPNAEPIKYLDGAQSRLAQTLS